MMLFYEITPEFLSIFAPHLNFLTCYSPVTFCLHAKKSGLAGIGVIEGECYKGTR